MKFFFIALLLILTGGILPLFCHRHPLAMKGWSLPGMVAGSLLGLWQALALLCQEPVVLTASCSWQQFLQLSFKLDSLSAFFLLPLFLLAPLAALYSSQSIKDARPWRRAAAHFFTALLVAAMALVATAANIITLALSWELMSLSCFFLIIHEYEAKEARQGGYRYLLFAQGGAMLLFAALALVYGYTGRLDFAGMGALPERVKIIVFLLAFLGFGSKADLFPLHVWMPYAYPLAPSQVAALMSGAMLNLGLYGIVRFYSLLAAPSLLLAGIVLLFGMASGMMGVLQALARQDIKKLLAYSSVENAGIVLIGLGAGMLGIAAHHKGMAFFGLAGALLHLLNHSLAKSLLFFGTGAVQEASRHRSIERLGGLLKRMPTTGRTFLAGALSLSGLPPGGGFVGEFLIYYALFQGVILRRTSFLLVLLALISLAVMGGLAAACFTKLFGLAFLGEPRSQGAAEAEEAGWGMRLPMLLLAAACLLIGIFPAPAVALAFRGLRGFPFLTAYDPALFSGLIHNLATATRLFLLFLLAAAGLRQLLDRRRTISRGPTWGCGFSQPSAKIQYTGASYAASILAFYHPLIPLKTGYAGLSRIFPGRTVYDPTLTDLGETALHALLARPLFKTIHFFRWIQHGNIQLYIAYIIAAILALLLLSAIGG